MKLRHIRTLIASIAVLATTVAPALGADRERIPRDKANLSLRNEVGLAIDKGLAWLKEQQKPEGYWSSTDHPALTALALTVFMREPSGKYRQSPPEFIRKGYDFLLSKAQLDGGIYTPEKGLANYNTSIAVMALAAMGDRAHLPVIRTARDFIVSQQARDMANPALNGGIGYGPGGTSRQHPDMNNTLLALEALSAADSLDAAEELPPARKKLDRAALLEFLTRCQNLPGSNPEPWASDDPANKGGFVYFPGHSMAGEMELPGGRKALKSFGSASYAGLLSFIYAELKKDDPRVVALLDWLRKNYTLDENPGMGAQGLYYYYQTMAKALAVHGADALELPDGNKINWRAQLALKLINQQKPEGFWINDNGRFMEKDPVLVTCYSLLALEVLFRGM